jgi:capsular exopolysaccharide synthesis family protein
MVTSALPREGKTFFAAAFARSAALAGERVLLIDCDLRRPAVARNIGTTEVDAFQGVAMRRDADSTLDTITLTAAGGSPQDLFASGRMRNLMELLRERYDLIMLDAPPVLAVSDARVLSTLCDRVMLVVCWQKTPQQMVNNAVRALRNGGANLAGAVITQVRLNELSPADGVYAYAYAAPKHAKVLLR